MHSEYLFGTDKIDRKSHCKLYHSEIYLGSQAQWVFVEDLHSLGGGHGNGPPCAMWLERTGFGWHEKNGKEASFGFLVARFTSMLTTVGENNSNISMNIRCQKKKPPNTIRCEILFVFGAILVEEILLVVAEILVEAPAAVAVDEKIP